MNLLEKLGLTAPTMPPVDPVGPEPPSEQAPSDPNADATTLVGTLPSGVSGEFCEDCGKAIHWQFLLVTKSKVFCKFCGQKKYWRREYCNDGHYSTKEPDPHGAMSSLYYWHSVYSLDGKSHNHNGY